MVVVRTTSTGGPMSRGRRTVGALAAAALAVVGVACDPQDSTLARRAEPVVVRGASATGLAGVAVGDVVAFRWDRTAGWQQVPVQIDERRDVDLGVVYDDAPSGVVVNVYADAGTFTGADPVVGLDADDEIVVWSGDAGGQPPAFSEPPGVVPGSGVDLRVTDPLQSGTAGHVYLFERTAGLDPAAGADRVQYTFDLVSGDYKTTYRLADGPNPEDSTVQSARYSVHFSDRWLVDEMRSLAPGAGGSDLIDVRKVQFGVGACGRSTATFNDAEGAFVTNVDGPLRAIRSYIGANSGPWTQRTHVFYEDREVVLTDLRVHSIPGIMDFVDYATGLDATYVSANDPTVVDVDGVPDTRAAGLPEWEVLDSAQGALVQVQGFTTNIPGMVFTSYYEDNAANPSTQCTGDADAWGASGPRQATGIACTDPEDGCTWRLRGLRTVFYESPGATAADGADRFTEVSDPLKVTTKPWQPPAPAS